MLVEQIDQSSIVALIGVLGTVLPVGISYVLTKNKEIDVGIRQEKTKRYDGLIDAIVIIDKSDPRDNYDAVGNFISAYNRAMAYASDLVLKRCNELVFVIYKREHQQPESDRVEQWAEWTNRARMERKREITKIYQAIRIDINPKAKFSEVLPMTQVEKEKATDNQSE